MLHTPLLPPNRPLAAPPPPHCLSNHHNISVRLPAPRRQEQEERLPRPDTIQPPALPVWREEEEAETEEPVPTLLTFPLLLRLNSILLRYLLLPGKPPARPDRAAAEGA